MFLYIKDFGLLQEISLELKKITILTGLNDSGKSSIVKLFFSLIKADNLAERRIEEYIKKKVEQILEQLKGIITQQNLSLAQELNKKIQNFFMKDKKQYNKNKFETEKFKREFSNILKQIEKECIENASIINLIKELEFFLNEEKAFIERRNRKFYQILTYNFGSNLNSFLKKSFSLQLTSAKKEVLYSALLEKGKIKVTDNLPKEGYKKIKPVRDVTYIETPLLMNIAEFLRELRERNCNTNEPFPFVFQDLSRKILSKDKFISPEVNNIISDILELIKGRFLLEKNLFFERNNKRINVIGVASGIKSFGILVRLIQTKAIQGSRDFLIVDEPEVHLHPEWQIRYVDIILKLIRLLDFNLIISTHSPYIIQAFAKLGFADNMHQDINFYLIQEGRSYLMNKKLNEIFKILGEPLWKVMI